MIVGFVSIALTQLRTILPIKDFLEIPVRDDASEFSTFRRGPSALDALAGLGISVGGKRVIDLGAGFGAMSLACSEAGAADVLAVDVNQERLDAIAARGAASGVVIRTRAANLLAVWDAPADADIAFLVGVVEYAGLWDTSAEVADLQVAIFRAAFDSLKPGGRLVFGSKNRLWPRFAIKDANTAQPLVNVLPRARADQLSQLLSGTPYRHHIHSPRGWAALMTTAGFDTVDTYVPFFSYQFPLRIVTRPRPRDVREVRRISMSKEQRGVAWGRAGLIRAAITVAAGTLGLQVGSSTIAVARKPCASS